MASNKHKLIMQKKPVRPERTMKRALRPFYRSKRDEEKKEKSDAKTEKDKDDEKDKQKDKSKEKDKQKDKSKDKDEEKDKQKDKSKDKGKDKEEDKVLDNDKADKSVSSKVRDKYQFDLLDKLNEQPTLRNELDFIRSHRPKKDKKTVPKPVPYMCDVCHVFGKSAFELNEHLTSEGHKEALRKFLKGEKSPLDKDSKDNDKPTEVEDSEEKKPKNPELYCDVCQLLLPSLGTKREHEKSKKHKFLEALRKKSKTEQRAEEAASAKKSESTKTVTAARTAKTLHCSVCQMDLESNEAMEEHVESKKHKFLSALKPVPPAPVRRPEEGTRHKRAGPRDSGPDRREWRRGKRRNEEEEEEIPELAAVALERRALQAQLAQRRQEIEEQRRLIAELREEQHLEAEKAALRHMIDECRKLLEEREKNKRRAAEVEESISRKTAKSVQWHPSVTAVKKEPEDPHWAKSHDYEEPRERLSLVKKAQEEWEREQLEKARSRGHAQPASTAVKQEEDDWEKERPSGGSSIFGFTSFSHWDGKIPLLDTAVETVNTDTSWPVQSRESPPTFRGPLVGEDRMIEPVSHGRPFGQVDEGAVFSQESLGNSGTNWPGAVHSPPVWSGVSQDSHDWNRPVLCTPSSSVQLLGEEPGPMRDGPSHLGEKSSFLGSREGLLEDRPSHLVERPSLLGRRPDLLEGRPNFPEDRPSLLGENRSLLGSKPSLLEDRPRFLEDRPHFLEDRPSLLDGRPSLLGSRPSHLEDRPSFLGENRSLLGSKPSLLEDRRHFLEDRPSPFDGRSSLLGSRPSHLEDRSRFRDGSPSFVGSRTSLLGDKPGLLEDRSSHLGERPEQHLQFWGQPSQRPTSEPEPWGGSSSLRIPGLDLV